MKPERSIAGRRPVNTSVLTVILFALLVVIGIVRIISTYNVFSETWDEVAHVATGMELLQNGTYTLEPMHPPLARVAVALGPFLAGIRWNPGLGMWAGGNAILAARNQYLHNLALARAGVLPFFIAGAFLTWFWAWRRYGAMVAGAAALFFTTCPVILGHAGLATTDMAAAAGFTGALLAFLCWLESPTNSRSAVLGAATALGVLCKFSVPVFLLASGAGLLLWRWLLTELGHNRSLTVAAQNGRLGLQSVTEPRPRGSGQTVVQSLVVAAVAATLVLWAGYRFTFGSLAQSAERPYSKIDRFAGRRGTAHDVVYALVESKWIPARPLVKGLAQVRDKEARGQKSFLLGQIRTSGWWYFFLVALAVKTPLPLLILAAVGALSVVWTSWATRNWIAAAPAIAAAATLLIAMAQHLSIGVRHVLPLYPLMAILAGVAFHSLWNSAGQASVLRKALAVGLLAWQIVASARAHPDYLAYFNELAGRHPEKILITSDLDWGQDLLRLSSTLKEKRVQFVSIAYSGPAELNHVDLPPFRALEPYEKATGWVAAGMMRRFTGGIGLPNDGFQWLSGYEPVGLVGKSILLYYIPERTAAGALSK